jgi:hypothetical protein
MSDATREIPNVTDRRLAILNYVKLFSNLICRGMPRFMATGTTSLPPGFSGSDYGSRSGLSWTFGVK